MFTPAHRLEAESLRRTLVLATPIRRRLRSYDVLFQRQPAIYPLARGGATKARFVSNKKECCLPILRQTALMFWSDKRKKCRCVA